MFYEYQSANANLGALQNKLGQWFLLCYMVITYKDYLQLFLEFWVFEKWFGRYLTPFKTWRPFWIQMATQSLLDSMCQLDQFSSPIQNVDKTYRNTAQSLTTGATSQLDQFALQIQNVDETAREEYQMAGVRTTNVEGLVAIIAKWISELFES